MQRSRIMVGPRRFLSAMCALGQGEFTLDGTHRMRQRPIGDLAAALESLGVQVTVSELQCPPITIRAIRSPKEDRQRFLARWLKGCSAFGKEAPTRVRR